MNYRLNRLKIDNPGPAIQCVGLVILLVAGGLSFFGAPVSIGLFIGGFIELLGWMVMLKS